VSCGLPLDGPNRPHRHHGTRRATTQPTNRIDHDIGVAQDLVSESLLPARVRAFHDAIDSGGLRRDFELADLVFLFSIPLTRGCSRGA
jgi:hypothetical protein